MNSALHQLRPWHLLITLAVISAAVLVRPAVSRADDAGPYAGRALLSGAPASAPKDQAQLADEPGSAALTADGMRLEGERIFGGYRFGPGFALEGAQTRTAPAGPAAGNQAISVAGVSSVPLSDTVKLVGKLGFQYPTSPVGSGGVSISDLPSGGKLYGVGVSAQVRDNVELRVQSEHFGRPAGASQGTAGSDSVLFGANVRF
ncbi:MAG TPA: hypothetical protein VMH26_00600 [Burkholderiales bacterium]|nr:hypothetical protein [Burkholderiales bacterium]